MHEDTSQVQLHLETHIHLCEGSQALCVNTLKALHVQYSKKCVMEFYHAHSCRYVQYHYSL